MNTSTDTSKDVPNLSSLRFEGAMGGRMAVSVDVTYRAGTEDEHALRVTFTGPTTPGYPGPVTLSYAHRDGHILVTDPARFGDTFGADWIRSFYGADR